MYSNLKFLFIFSTTAFVIGLLTLFAINPLTSAIVKSYEDIKGKYDVYKNHLASITSNGIWIKEKIGDSIQIIQADSLEANKLIDVSVYKFDKNKKLFERNNIFTKNNFINKMILRICQDIFHLFILK